MIGPEEIAILDTDRCRSLIDRHLRDDPYSLAFALKSDPRCSVVVRRQIANLQKAEKKIPSYHAARCIVPSLPYEQCSSEEAAGRKLYEGALCIDLTCGLGVDAFHFSKRFARVVAVERDPSLARIAEINFGRLGCDNMEVVNDWAENFVARYRGEKADLVYLDPARRKEGRKVFLIEDCSPNLTELLPGLLRIGKKVVVKLSPLFDVAELERKFGEHLRGIVILSVDRECREILAELEDRPGEKYGLRVDTGYGRAYVFGTDDPGEPLPGRPAVEAGRYLLIPDPAFYKGRLLRQLFRKYYPETEVFIPTESGFAFAWDVPAGFPGRAYRVGEIRAYKPKELSRYFKKEGISRLNILRRDFPWSTETIKKSLGIREGGTRFGAFTSLAGKNLFISVVPEKN